MKKELEKLATKFKKNFAVRLGFDDELAHLIEAGSDMFLSKAPTANQGLGFRKD